jgi:transcriptional regulator GlxA family with amidase domain
MQKTRIVFLVLPRVHLLDLAGPDQVFYEARDHGLPLEVLYCSYTENVTTSTGMLLGPYEHYAGIELTKGDYLVVPGAELSFLNAADIRKEKELFAWVVSLIEKGVFVCSVCTGAFFLAMTGVLNGRVCTTHWKRTSELQQKFPRLKVVENSLFTHDGLVWTSAGVTAGIDMALHIVSQMSNEQLSFQVARELVVYRRRQGGEQQQSIFMQHRNHIHAAIHRVQDHIQLHIGKPLTLIKLAEIACMSPRNLTRLFKKETGISVNQYLNTIRLAHLKQLLGNKELTRKQLAFACGLRSERQVIRLINNINKHSL